MNNVKVANGKYRLYLSGMADKQLLISVLALHWSRKCTLIDDTSFFTAGLKCTSVDNNAG
jgi:hypothetical protein